MTTHASPRAITAAAKAAAPASLLGQLADAYTCTGFELDQFDFYETVANCKGNKQPKQQPDKDAEEDDKSPFPSPRSPKKVGFS